MRKTTYIQAINEAMKEEMRRDERVYLMGEDIGHYGGLFRVTRNLMEEFGERRVIDTPISEQGFIGMAVGSAMAGMADNASRVNSVARIAMAMMRHENRATVKIVPRTSRR